MRLLIFGLCFLSAIATKELSPKQYIVWNIGQGQWTTYIDENTCSHFDMGGEYNLSSRIAKICSHKKNIVHLSHWDMDHVGFVKKYFAKAPNLCLFERPYGPHSPAKDLLIKDIPLCDLPTDVRLQAEVKIYDGAHLDNEKKSNENCRVYLIKKEQILIPGDSTQSEEKKWAKNAGEFQIKGLVLGHHGSKTSTSQILLDHLPYLKWAVSTARFKKYGHPHPSVVQRLRDMHIPLLKTEDWGSLHFIL